MKQNVINCPYCFKPYDLMLTPDRKGEGLALCLKCKKKFQVIWDITVNNDIKVFRLESIHTNPILIDGEPPSEIMGFQNSAAAKVPETMYKKHFDQLSRFRYEKEQYDKRLGAIEQNSPKPTKAPESSFQVRSISSGVNHNFKGEIGMDGANGPFIAKRFDVCCNSRKASVSFFSYRNAKKAPVSIYGKKEDVRDLLWAALKELIKSIEK